MRESTNRSRLARSAVRLIAVIAVAGAALSACGDDKSSDRATHEEWFTAACATIGGDQSGFAEFSEAHPDEASLEEWAEFLPTPIAFVDRIIAAAELPHPSEDDAGMAATIAAVEKVQDSWQAAIDAANAGDDAAFDAAMGAAEAALGELDVAMKAVDPRDCPAL